MLGWGQWASYTPRMLGRITTGLVTTLAGGALLALEVIKIDDRSFDQLFVNNVDTRDMLLITGLGIVFGFSERALVQFQQLVFRDDNGRASETQSENN